MSEETRIQLNVCDWKLNSEECTRRIFFSFLLFFFFFFPFVGFKRILEGKRGIRLDREIFACAIIWNSLSRKVTQVGRVKRNCDTLGERQRARSNRCRANLNNAARSECCHLSTQATSRNLAIDHESVDKKSPTYPCTKLANENSSNSEQVLERNKN